jgi:hypothetical protein
MLPLAVLQVEFCVEGLIVMGVGDSISSEKLDEVQPCSVTVRLGEYVPEAE